MNSPRTHRAVLADRSPSVRLRAALEAGTGADPGLLEVLIERCAVEPDFSVRDTLSWALTRLPARLTVPRLRAETRREQPQAVAQALHTLSKIGDPDGWQAITPAVLHAGDREVARSAWRAAVVLVPDDRREWLASMLAARLGRGDAETQRSVSRALVALGPAADAAIADAAGHPDERVRVHARATRALAADPDTGFDAALTEARRLDALGFLAQGG